MCNDQDPIISQLFTDQDQSLPPDSFMLKLGERIDKQQRARRVYRGLAIAACLLLAILCAPWVAQITSTLIELTVGGVSAISPIFRDPLTWLVAGATAAGSSPVLYLWRTGRW